MNDDGTAREQALDEPLAGQADDVSEASLAGLEVDWEALAVAVENQLPSSHSYLHRTSGQVFTLQASEPAGPSPPDDSGLWLLVPPRPSREGYRTMQSFVEQLDETPLKEKLVAALVGRGAFRRFKDQLLEFPEQRQLWFAFKDAEVYSYISTWLERVGLKPLNPAPTNSSRSKFSAAVRRSATQRPSPGDVPVDSVGLGDRSLDWRAAIAPFDRTDRVFRPTRVALLLIDMQRVFVDPAGSSFLPMSEEALAKLVTLVAAWRETDQPLIFTRHVHVDPRQDGGAMSRWWRSLIIEGSEDSQLVEVLAPRDGERVIPKSRYNAFANTELEMILRSMQVEDVLIGGVMTNLCCETTAREAFVRDFNVFFLGDGTAAANSALHLSSLRNIAYGFGRVLSVGDALHTIGASGDDRIETDTLLPIE